MGQVFVNINPTQLTKLFILPQEINTIKLFKLNIPKIYIPSVHITNINVTFQKLQNSHSNVKHLFQHLNFLNDTVMDY